MPLRPADENLFEESRMTFGEHLEELRKVLIRALLGAAVGMVIGLLLADRIVLFLQGPLNRAIAQFNVTRAREQLAERSGGLVPPEVEPLLDQRVLAPRRVMIDPGQLVQALRAISPTALADVDLSPYQFSAFDLSTVAARELCQRLATAAEGSAGIASRRAAILKLMSPERAAQLRSLAAAPPEGNLAEEREVLRAALNEVVVSQRLQDHPAFATLFERPSRAWYQFSSGPPNLLKDMKDRIAADPEQNVDGQRRLNRLLIWQTLFDETNRPQLPLAELDVWESAEIPAQSLTATEGFMIWMKAGMIAGLFIASPWIFYQLWSFVAAGLYPREQRYVYTYLPLSLLLFFGGAAMAFFLVFDPVLNFLFQFNARMGIEPQPRIGDWLTFVLLLPLGFGIAFQLPIVMFFLNLLGLVSVRTYLEKWRIAILVIFFIAMVLTPAEPISMLMMALPLTVLYFLGIGLCRWLPGRSRYRNVYEV